MGRFLCVIGCNLLFPRGFVKPLHHPANQDWGGIPGLKKVKKKKGRIVKTVKRVGKVKKGQESENEESEKKQNRNGHKKIRDRSLGASESIKIGTVKRRVERVRRQ